MLVSQTSASHPCREIKRSHMTRASSFRVMLRFQGNNQVLSRTETLTSLTVEIQQTMSKFTNAKILQVHQKILMYQKTNSPSMLAAASKRKALSQFAWPSTLLTNRGHLPLRTLTRLTTRSWAFSSSHPSRILMAVCPTTSYPIMIKRDGLIR